MKAVALAMGMVLAGGSAGAVDVHGFVEAAHGVRTVRERSGSAYTLNEVRAQLRLDAYDDVGDAFVRADVVQDDLRQDGAIVELREAYFRFSTFGNHLEVKAGRQIATWGTGDLVFINDLFPKDWVSFFTGRDDPYLKAPIDALRLGIFGLPLDVDVVVTPRFTPDNVPTGRYLGPVPEADTAIGIDRPEDRLENAEIALRVTRAIGQATLCGYAYRGFSKAPESQRKVPDGVERRHARMSVVGASLRSALGPGIVWIETGWVYSHDAYVRSTFEGMPSSWRGLIGSEWQPVAETTLAFQAYVEKRDLLGHSFVPYVVSDEEFYELVTIRLERMWRYETWRTSFFGFVSPQDEDVYVRGLVSHQVSDAASIALGVNVFGGRVRSGRGMEALPDGRFGVFDRDDNVFARLRYAF